MIITYKALFIQGSEGILIIMAVSLKLTCRAACAIVAVQCIRSAFCFLHHFCTRTGETA
jgi:hypothetical protein